MTLKFLPKVFCLSVACLSLARGTTRKEPTEEVIERVLGISNPDRILSSILNRLERNRQEILQIARSRFNDRADCDDTEGLPEYTESLENSRERRMNHEPLEQPKHDRICKVNRTIHRLNTKEYEYRPAYYEEVRCNTSTENVDDHKHQLCSTLGLTCVQWDKTIHLTRRRYDSDCWETKTLVIPAGCECMWPAHKLGAISDYLISRQ